MKNAFCLLLLLLPLVGLSQEVDVDTKNASVSFNFVQDNTKGTIDEISASIQLNPMDLGKSIIKGTANVAALSTENKGRDKHLKSKDFFDVENYPTMKFTSSSIEKDGDNFIAKGSLTIKDVTKEVTFSLTMIDKDMIFETTIYASDFNVSVKKDREKNKVEVKVKVPISQ
jgi:polyisoprenoid-binding protein YceI